MCKIEQTDQDGNSQSWANRPNERNQLTSTTYTPWRCGIKEALSTALPDRALKLAQSKFRPQNINH